ncbi:hypothetical protein NKW55_05070 [Gluconobacter kondonii]|uniref:hypothetical protein n=1 Tax=Gluconobacter kondonii TaxID=941463 RepID=UPI00209CF839|nr:hypothetical protein [Gluconobacter kondonii]MCP1235977.1 hypothetical protein [Gluconobacter kondonii]
MRFRTVEMDIVLPAVIQPATDPAWGGVPWGALTQFPDYPESKETLRFSDGGYVDETHIAYPPFVSQALDLTRSLTLSADAMGGSYSIGILTLANPDGVLDGLLQTRVNDHLPVRIREGVKAWDPDRQIWRDPASSVMRPVFAGLGKNWQPGLKSVSVTLLDATYWLDGAMPTQVYGGTGGLDGDSNVNGRDMPRLRGRVCNITPVLIDSTNYVYQISDAPAVINALYEGGFSGGVVSAGTVSDLYAVSPQPGTFVIQSSSVGTWIRLGTKPVYGITVDAEGYFRSGATPVNVLDILYQILIEDLTLPATYIDNSWAAVSQSLPYAAGWYWDGSGSVTGRQVISTLLSGLGVSMVPTRTGTLLPIVLKDPAAGGTDALVLTPDVISSISSVSLDASLDPPTWRWRIGWQHNFTVQTSGSNLHPQASADRQSLIAESDRTSVWLDTAVKSAWRVPNDPSLITTALASQTDAKAVANLHGALWGQRRHLWAVEVPQSVAILLDLGDPVQLQAPVPGAAGGVSGLVVGEHITSASNTTTLTILV